MLSQVTAGAKKISLNAILPTIFILFFLLGDSASNTYDLSELRRFIGGFSKDEYDDSEFFWANFPFAMMSSISISIVILLYWKAPDLVLTQADKHEHEHKHSWKHHLKDFLLIGTPFALLAYGGSKPFLDMLVDPTQESSASSENHQQLLKQLLTISLSVAAALAAGFGYMKLHEAHLHAKESYFKLISQLHSGKKIRAIVVSVSVLLGHFFQGSLDGFAFMKTLHIPNKIIWSIIQYAAIFLFGVSVAVFEGNTEMRSTLLYELGKSTRPNPHLLSRIILIIPSIFNGLMPSIGFVNCIETIYKESAKDDLVHHLNLAERLGLLTLSLLVFGIANAYTFMNVALPAVDVVVDKSKQFFTRCRRGSFFHTAAATSLLNEDGEATVILEKQSSLNFD